MVNDPIPGAFAAVAGVADEDHHVVGIFLDPGLMKEEQVAAPGLAAVAADECDVVIFERARVGEFREFSGVQIRLLKRSEVGAKKLLSERTAFEVISFHIWRDRLVSLAPFVYGLIPGPVMAAQRFAPREANQSRAIALIFVPAAAQI